MSDFVSFALLSGTFGAVAGSLAKLAFSKDTSLVLSTFEACHDHLTWNQSFCGAVVLGLRGLLFVGTLILNIFMVGSFVEGMEESGSVAGTGLSSAANFGVSSLLGFFFWGEDSSREWWLGFSLVMAGSLLLSTVKAGVEKEEEEKEKEKEE